MNETLLKSRARRLHEVSGHKTVATILKKREEKAISDMGLLRKKDHEDGSHFLFGWCCLLGFCLFAHLVFVSLWC
jgi:hypothetical protein